MATYVNNLRLKEIATGAESGTWGTSTNTNLELIGEGLGYGTKQMSADSNETFTMSDGAADPTRAFYLKITSAVSLTTTRTITLAPNTVSKIWIIENATSGAQSLSIKQGSGTEVTIANGKAVILYTDGAGASGAVSDALQFVDVGDGTVTSVGGTGTVNGLTLSGTVTSSGNLTLGGTLSNVDLAAAVTGTLPVGNGGTGAATLVANSVLIGSGTSPISTVAPSTTGNVLTSTGSAWASTAPSGQPDPTLTGVNLSPSAGQFVVATAGGITITLPGSPSAGDFVIVKDGTGAAATTTFAVARNGSNIASAASDLTFDKNFAEITMTYINGTIGWSV
mgnify:CR=1 FL=1|tara:strand:+ start:1446 stop:2456 length:1011 start_codon:yes stop_codon:yes gene_type:complete